MPRQRTIPPVLTERESERPDSHRGHIERLRVALLDGDREIILDSIRQILDFGRDRAEVREKAHAVVVEGFRERIDELRTELEEKDRELDEYKRRQRGDNEDRDRSIERLRKRDEELAERLDDINRPKTEATATAATATVINAARKRELLEKALWAVALVIVYVLTLLGVRLPTTAKPVEPVPDLSTQPRPAGTGFAGTP